LAESSLNSPVIRPARRSDRDAMLRITREVWDGTDYVPFQWQRWLDDRAGYLCVADWNDNVVGLQHTTVQPDGTAWMEGIRVEEAMRGRGVGAAMLHHSLEWARSADCPVARLSTSSENQSSLRVAQKAGFREVNRFDVLAGPTSPPFEPVHHVRLAHGADLAALQDRLLHDWSSGASECFYTEGWTAYRLTTERINLLVAVHALALVEEDNIAAVGIATSSVGRPVLRVGYLNGSPAGKTSIVAWMRGQVHAASLEQMRAILPSDPSTTTALESLGLISSAEFSMVLWELEL
jgi:GNAT superfamily N-acetyltransferase